MKTKDRRRSWYLDVGASRTRNVEVVGELQAAHCCAPRKYVLLLMTMDSQNGKDGVCSASRPEHRSSWSLKDQRS